MGDFVKKLQALSEKQKIAIIVVVVVIAVLIMGYFWVKSATSSISTIGDSFNPMDLPKIDIPVLPTVTPSPSPSPENPTPSVSPTPTPILENPISD